MKRTFALILLMICAVAFAGVETPFVQFAPTDYCTVHAFRTNQDWFGAQLITLDVKAGTDVWLSNYVKSFYETIADLHGSQFDMVGDQKYGYIYKNALADFNQKNYESLINWSDGSVTTDVTYFADVNPNLKQTTTAYFLDHFDTDSEIYLVMTTLPADGSETVDSYQEVQDTANGIATSLYSRQHNTIDVAGNVRINFGINSYDFGKIGREFVAVYNAPDEEHGGAPSGQPLPGVMTSCLLAGGVISLLKMKRKKKEESIC